MKNSVLKSMALALVLSVFCGSAVAQMATALVRDGNVPASSGEIYDNAADVTGPLDATDATKLDRNLNNISNSGVGVVDWVEVQLRKVAQDAGVPTAAPTAEGAVAFKAGLLLSDGRVVDADTIADLDPTDAGAGVLSFEEFVVDDATEDLYVAVIHRNHLAILSANVVDADDAGEYVYTFIDGVTNTHNGGVKSTDDGWAMLAGDADGNAGVDSSDADAIRALAGNAGYLPTDATLNGNTDSGDVDITLPNSGNASQLNY